jgi:putative phage-type endonuclease
MDQGELAEWCDEHLPELYNPGYFDDEETTLNIRQELEQLAQNTVLDFLDDEEARYTMLDEIQDAAEDWFRTNRTAEIDALMPLSEEQISAILSRPQTAQHSGDWYAQRNNRLTASEFAKILDGRRGRLLREKIAQTPGEWSQSNIGIATEDGRMNACVWGHRFEPIVRQIYELESAGVGTVTDSIGRLTHPTIPWMSASPDGLVTRGPLAGRLVEIKAPYSRDPEETEFVYKDYYPQMQIQMEVCDLEAVDFTEAIFDQCYISCMETHKDEIQAAKWKGIIRVLGKADDSSTWNYQYTLPVEDLEDAVLPVNTDDSIVETSVWWLKDWYPRTVLRNPT